MNLILQYLFLVSFMFAFLSIFYIFLKTIKLI